MNLDNVEPFTLVIFHGNVLIEVKWEGGEKHVLNKSIEYYEKSTLFYA